MPLSVAAETLESRLKTTRVPLLRPLSCFPSMGMLKWTLRGIPARSSPSSDSRLYCAARMSKKVAMTKPRCLQRE